MTLRDLTPYSLTGRSRHVSSLILPNGTVAQATHQELLNSMSRVAMSIWSSDGGIYGSDLGSLLAKPDAFVADEEH